MNRMKKVWRISNEWRDFIANRTRRFSEFGRNLGADFRGFFEHAVRIIDSGVLNGQLVKVKHPKEVSVSARIKRSVEKGLSNDFSIDFYEVTPYEDIVGHKGKSWWIWWCTKTESVFREGLKSQTHFFLKRGWKLSNPYSKVSTGHINHISADSSMIGQFF